MQGQVGLLRPHPSLRVRCVCVRCVRERAIERAREREREREKKERGREGGKEREREKERERHALRACTFAHMGVSCV